MNVLNNSEIDRNRWDSLVEQSVSPKITSFSWYLDVVCPQWKAIVGDDYSWGFVLPEKRKFGIKYLIQPFMIQQLGLIYLHEDFNISPTIGMCLEYVKSHYLYFDFNINGSSLGTGRVESSPSNNLLLNLQQSYESVRDGYSANVRRNLKKSAESGIVVNRIDAFDGIIGMFVDDKGDKVGWNSSKSLLLVEVLNAVKANSNIDVRGAFSGDELVSGAVFIGFGGRWTFIFSGNSGRGRETSSMFSIIDSFVHDSANQALTLDFEGSNDQGLYRFYKSFGAYDEKYLRVTSKIKKISFSRKFGALSEK